MDKTLKFEAKMDMAEFNRDIDQMQKKLKDMYAPSDLLRSQQQNAQRAGQMGMGGITNPSSAQYQSATQQQKRDQEKLLREGIQMNQALGKEIEKRWAWERKINEELSKKNQLTDEAIRLQQQLSAHQDNTRRMTENYQQRQELIDKVAAGSQPPPKAGVSGGNILKALGLVAAGSAAVDNYNALPMARQMSAGNTATNIFAEQNSQIRSGNSIGLNTWAPERMRAQQMAQDRANSRETWGAAGTMGAGVVGLAKGAVGGDISMRQDAGGNLLAATIAKAVGTALEHSMTLQAVKAVTGFDAAGRVNKIGDNYQNTYEQKMSEMQSKDYVDSFNSMKQENTLKGLGEDYANQNYQSDLANQRRLGMNDKQYLGQGGFKSTINRSGFNDTLGDSMSGAIGAAGGSTSAQGTQGTLMALRAQRGFGLSNAGSLIGQISQGAGGTQASQAVFGKLLQQSVRDGFDETKTAEAIKFSSVQAAILSKNSVQTADDAQRLLEKLSGFLGSNKTMQGIAGAQGAYEEANNASGEAGGRTGSIQFANLLKNPKLKKIGAGGLGAVMQLKDSELTSTNPMVNAYASQGGYDNADDFIKDVTEAKNSTLANRSGLGSKEMAPLQKWMKDNNMTVDKLNSVDAVNKMPADIKKLYYKATTNSTLVNDHVSTAQDTAATQGLIGVASGGSFSPSAGPDISNKMNNTDTGRYGDNINANNGAVSEAFLKNFNDFKDIIAPDSTLNKGFDAFVQKIIILQGVLNKSTDANRAADAKGAMEALRMNQPGPKKSRGQ